MKDPVVEEVRAARDAMAAKCNYDIHAIAANARRRQREWGHRVVDLSLMPEARRNRRASAMRSELTVQAARRRRGPSVGRLVRQHAKVR